jgi:hypothetical protein
MKKLILFCFVIPLFAAMPASWVTLDSSNGVVLQGYAYVDYKGCGYGGQIVNTSSDYVIVNRSKVKARFKVSQYYSSTEKTKIKSKNRIVRLPRIFMKPNSTAFNDGSRNDNNSTTYLKVRKLTGELGFTQVAPGNVSNGVLIPNSKSVVLHESDKIKIYAFSDEARFAKINSFVKKPINIIIENKSNETIDLGKLSFRVYYNGIYNEIEKNFRKIKPGKDKKLKDDFENTHFNFDPIVRVEIMTTVNY